jgi:Asp-tRNA(Asn)/Glu-tRNA(Gln) amidotransferase A subunit family amidase
MTAAVPGAMTFDEYSSFDACGLAELVQRGQIAPGELLELAIGRAEEVKSRINAIVVPCYERARAEVARGLPQGMFHGVPLLVKDLGFWMTGVECAEGSRLFQGHVPREDDTVVKRLRKAGFVIFGRTHSPELGITAGSESRLHGKTHNPWNLDHIAGGSSAGSAAAVAARIVPMATGTDGGGSIRIPASCCGLFGMKPTRGRIPFGPRAYELVEGLAVSGVLTVSVRDSAAYLDAIEGPDIGDPYGFPSKARSFMKELTASCKPLSIGVVDGGAVNCDIDADCRQALETAVSICNRLGHHATDASRAFARAIPSEDLGLIWSVKNRLTVDDRLAQLQRDLHPDDLELVTRWVVDQADRFSAVDLTRARAALHRASRRMAELMHQFDVLLMPTLAKPPLKFGIITHSREDVEQMFREHVAFSPFCIWANYTGQPAMSIPVHWTPDNLPVGVQFYGRFGDEATLFRLAARIEEAYPWTMRRPDI